MRLSGAVGIHDEDLAIGLERVVVERNLVADSADAAISHDLAIRCPYRMTVIDPVVVSRSRSMSSGRMV